MSATPLNPNMTRPAYSTASVSAATAATKLDNARRYFPSKLSKSATRVSIIRANANSPLDRVAPVGSKITAGLKVEIWNTRLRMLAGRFPHHNC